MTFIKAVKKRLKKRKMVELKNEQRLLEEIRDVLRYHEACERYIESLKTGGGEEEFPDFDIWRMQNRAVHIAGAAAKGA